MDCRVEELFWSIDGKAIIRGIALNGEDSRITGIIDPKGNGKTTLLKNIYRVLKPQSGAV